jgi:hypothetical protein
MQYKGYCERELACWRRTSYTGFHQPNKQTEFTMSSAAISTSSQSPVLPAYVSNVGSALRSLIAAILAVKPEQARPVTVKAVQAVAVTRAPSLRELYRMAGQSDSVNLKVAPQLDFLASR